MEEGGFRVSLNVYDLSQGLARQLSSSFLGKTIEGIWHTGVVVYGNEYYFGGGIQHDPVGKTPYGSPIKVVELGITHIPKDVFESYLQEISPRYTAATYSLLSHNCNNFSNEVSQFLVGVDIPSYILQLPSEVMSSPMGALIMPMIQNLEATMRAGAVPQAPQFKPTAAAAPSPVKESKKRESSSKTEEKPRGDVLGDARSKVQEEITKEFAAIMATGTLRASEAAALATRRVMQRYNVSA